MAQKSEQPIGKSASQLIDRRIRELGDWRGEALGRMRKLIKEADPERRRRVEVDGDSGLVARRHHLHRRILQAGRETHLRQGRVLQGSGPSLQLESRRQGAPCDRHPGRREIDGSAFKALIRQAVALNGSGKSKPSGKMADGAHCTVVGGTHAGKSGTVRDIKTGKTGHVSITVVQKNGERFKTLARNVVVKPLRRVST